MKSQPVTQQELDRLHAAWESAPESRSFAPLADAYHRAGRNEEAIELLRTGTARHPDYLSALVLLADCYNALGRVDEADAIFARVLSQDEENVRALEHQAEQSLLRGAVGRAAALVEKLRQIDPWEPSVRRLSARLQDAPPPQAQVKSQPPSQPMRPGAAPPVRGPIRSVEEAVYAGASEIDPLDTEPQIALPNSTPDELSTLTLAQIYESQGYLQKALTIYERLLHKHPDNAQVAERLERLRRRLAGADDTAHEPPSPPTASEPAPPAHWRLVDAQSLQDLQPPRPTARRERAPQKSPAPGGGTRPRQPATGDAAAARDEDFQRFLRYVRSLGR